MLQLRQLKGTNITRGTACAANLVFLLKMKFSSHDTNCPHFLKRYKIQYQFRHISAESLDYIDKGFETEAISFENPQNPHQSTKPVILLQGSKIHAQHSSHRCNIRIIEESKEPLQRIQG